jgi:hypothetical protein
MIPHERPSSQAGAERNRTSLTLANARGLPQLNPKFASCGILASSSSLYPNAVATFWLYFAFSLALAAEL